nr:retrovirus-related Pol polyprotein from transposon TNT 1-94 [Tanacetum cinerariifolium]
MLFTIPSWKQVNPPYQFKWTEKTVPVVEGIDNDSYSRVDACPNACEMWKTIERLKQGESINVQDLEINLYWGFGKFTSRDVAEDVEMSKEKKIDKLIALTSLSLKKIYKPTNNNLRTSLNTSRANQNNSLRIKRGIGYDNQRIVNVAGARENVGAQVVQQSRIQCYNCKEYRHVARECQKPKRAKHVAYHKEKVLLCKQEEAGFQLNAEQADWRDVTDDEPNDQELEAHYKYIVQVQEVTLEAADNSGPIFDTEPLQKVILTSLLIHWMSTKGETIDQDDNDLARERDLLASLIKKLKCEIDDNKNCNKFLESSNKALVDKLKGEIEDFKTKNKSLELSNNHFKEANNELSKTNQLMFKDLKKFQAELDRYHDVNYASKNDIVIGLLKLKFVKDHLCSSCELGKAKQKSFHTKTTLSSKRRLQLLHVDLCGSMWVESIIEKKYVLIIVDEYSRYTWTYFLRSKDKTQEVLINFLKLVQRGLYAQVRIVQTDKGLKFLNKSLHAYVSQEWIEHQTSTARTPEQNGVVERRNRTLVEAARTMLSAAKVPLFFWAEVISTTCFTQNRSLVVP